MIYIVKHKEYNNPVPDGHKELGVGDMFKGSGENINNLNYYINEATAYYDLWKNCKDPIKGICHYRRFFAENGEIIKISRVEEILTDNEMIAAEPFVSTASLYRMLKADLAPGYEMQLFHKYLDLFYEAEPGFDIYMHKEKSFYQREMMIAKEETFNEFCEGLFEVVIPLAEKYHKEDSGSKTNPRLLGFITERFFSYWIIKNGYKVYPMEFINI